MSHTVVGNGEIKHEVLHYLLCTIMDTGRKIIVEWENTVDLATFGSGITMIGIRISFDSLLLN